MAKNISRANTYKQKEKEEGKTIKLGFFGDRRFLLAVGLFLLIVSLYLFTAFISYLFTHKADQSVVEAVGQIDLRESGQETENWLGLFGAITSHYFIFKWFGIATFLIPPLLFNIGYSIVFKSHIVPLSKALYFTIFFLFWMSILLGYFVFRSEGVTEWGFISGGIGYELSVLLNGLVGWGTYLFLIFTLLVFIIFYFNVTTLLGFSPKKDFESEIDEKSEASNPGNTVELISEQEVESMSLSDDEDEIELNKPEVKNIDHLEDVKPDLELDIEGAAEDVLQSDEKADTTMESEPEFEVSQRDFKEKVANKVENYDPTLDLASYKYPPLDLLNKYDSEKVQVTKDELEQNKDKIIETLINFKIGISSIKATIGPTVTLYEIVPQAGIKISKIKNLEDDIALSLSALGIRIIAPIPGKGTIGIEVPNKNREMVDMRSVLSTEKFLKSDKELPVALGKTISNELLLIDLVKLPHLLMAGATGQGKSVGLNVIIASLIYKKHPSQLKFVLVDPKKVELTVFNKLEKHFLAKLPDGEDAIITDTRKVVNTLNSLCIEMDNRYNLMKDAGARNLKEYNAKFIQRKLNPLQGHRFMPYIVLIIDELADLMMTAGKEVEGPITRLAQLARAIGIHLIIATQRPSVNVITGLIKANFPARLSFRVTSKIDSRTILDSGGAEQLVGLGDMLLDQGSNLTRLQCPFVDAIEIERICDFIGEQQGYDSAYILPEYVGDESGDKFGEVDLSDRDALFDEAAKLIVRHQQGSTSLIQRKLKLGYNRAGRLIDQLEAAGIVGPFEGSKAREVLIQDEYSLEQLLNSLE